MIKRFVRAAHLALAILALAAPALASTPVAEKPLVIKTGQIQQIPDADCLNLSASNPVWTCQGTGAPAITNAPTGSLYYRTDVPLVYQWLGSPTPTRVQEAVSGASYAVTLSAPPTVGNVLYAMVSREGALPTLAAGWTQVSSYNGVGATDPYAIVACHVVQNGDGASWTPASGASANNSTEIIEVSGLPVAPCQNAATVYFTSASLANGSISTTITQSTPVANTLAVAMGAYVVQTCLPTGATLALNSGWSNVVTQSNAASCTNWSGNNIVGSEFFTSASTSVTATISGGHTASLPLGQTEAMFFLAIPASAQGWQIVSQLSTVFANGSQLTPANASSKSLTFPSCTGSDDGFGNETVNCAGASGAVTVTGSPASGNLAKWSSATSVTNGDLSGDCTTSGTLATTCLKTNGVAFGTAATVNTGTSGGTLCLLNTNCTFSGAETFSSTLTVSSLSSGGTQCAELLSTGQLAGTGSACGSGGGGSGTVTSVACPNGTITVSGNCYSPTQPQGRLTLVTGTPVMTSDQTAKATIYYDCYAGKLVPYYDGTTDQADSIASCEVSLTMVAGANTVGGDNTTSGGINNAGVFDIWWVHGGTNRICIANGAASGHSGGGWSSDTGGSTTARGSGYSQVHNTRGYWTNVNSIAHCWNGSTDYGTILADQATLLGTLTTTAAGQTTVQFTPAAASGGANCFIGLANVYNPIPASCISRDSTGSWTYASSVFRAANNNNSNRVTYIDPLGQFKVRGAYEQTTQNGNILLGMDRDSTSATPQAVGQSNLTAPAPVTVADAWPPSIGLHFIQAIESATSGTGTFFGAQTTPTRQLQQLVVDVLY